MLTDKKLEKFLKDESFSKISKEQLDKIIDDEMKKPESEIDTGLIEYCLNLMDGIDKKTQSDDINKNGSGDKNVKTLKFSFRHIAALAAVISIVIVAAVSGSASVSHYKMYDGAIEVDGNSVFPDLSGFYGESQSTDMPDDALIKELSDNGVSGVLLPRALLSGAIEVTNIEYNIDEWRDGAYIEFTYDDKYGNISIEIEKYDYDDRTENWEFLQVSSVVEMVKTDKATAFCFSQFKNEFTTIIYRSGKALYVIQIPVELDEAVQIAKTIN